MATTHLFRFLLRGVIAVALTGLWVSSAAAQPPGGGAGKLDPVLRARAQQLTGRSRVIVQFKAAPDGRVIPARGVARRTLSAGRAQVADLDNSALAALAADSRVARVTIDRPVFATLERTGAVVGAALARQQFDVTGRGIGVAVVDSGITEWHDDLNLARGARTSTGRVVHFKDFTRADGGRHAGSDLPSDDYGHGTHVAGIIAGSGYASNGAREGIAPGAHLVGLKVLDAEGHGYISDVIAAIDHAIALKDRLNIRVINLSVASGVFESYHLDPLAQAARRAVEAGIVVVAAAGNLGQNAAGELQSGAITSPGNAPWVLTVGASTHQGTDARSDDAVARFSSRGPTWIDFASKPDLVAPGVGIESLSDPRSMLYASHADYLLDGKRGSWYKPYLSLSGTSMAAPVVAGTVALMLEANPSLTPNAVKAILQYTAELRENEPLLAQGAGLLNARGALRLARFFASPERGLRGPSDMLEGERVRWARHIIWGNYRISGGVPLPGSNAWTANVAWGSLRTPTGQNVVWGARASENIVWSTADQDNIVWSTRRSENVVWGTHEDNIVWSTDDQDNIVWSTGDEDNIVWSTGDEDNIVWSTGDADNIVWSTGGGGKVLWATDDQDNIVWSTGDVDNIVWSTAVAQNVVWGNDCGGRNCARIVWGARSGAHVWGTASDHENIVWSTGDEDNIVWSTGDADNIVWSTGDEDNIVWSTADFDNIVWSTSDFDNIVWSTGDEDNIVWSTGLPDPVLWSDRQRVK